MAEEEILIPHPYDADARATLEAALSDLEGATVTVAETPTETRAGFESATIAITPRLPDEWLDRADRLGWAQATSAGVDHYDREALAERGIVLTSAAGVHAQPIAEHVLGAVLSFERGLFEAYDQQREGVWHRGIGSTVGEVGSKTVGIVGLGSIGARVAELASAVGATVVGTKRDPGDAPGAVDEVHPADDLEAILPRTDYLVLACPLTEETRGLIDERAFETLPSEAVLVNVARGPVVAEEALVDALRQGRIAGAALDVFAAEPLPAESPLWDLPNVLVTPHVAGSTPQYYERVATIVRENYGRYRDGARERMRNRVA